MLRLPAMLQLVPGGLPWVPFGCFINGVASPPLGHGDAHEMPERTGQAFVSQTLVVDAEATQGIGLVSPCKQLA